MPTVTTQTELDEAIAAGVENIIINSPQGVWLDVVSATVTAYDSATVRAYDSATVRAYGQATVRAYDSATVRAYDSATVRAYDSATVRAYGQATVRAYDSATVRAYDSATVRAYGSATVRAYGSATVRASDSATVTASRFVAVHLHSKFATVAGGVVIDVSALDLTVAATWLDYSGVDVADDGNAVVYKAVDVDLNAGHNHTVTTYPIGGAVEAPDWKPTRECGNGLHFGAGPHHALNYYTGASAPRLLACRVAVDTLVPLGDKCKAPSCEVLHEVDAMGREVPA